MSGREHGVTFDAVLRAASASKCSAYDCEFVALPQELHVPFVSTDVRLVKKFPNTAIHLRDFVID